MKQYYPSRFVLAVAACVLGLAAGTVSSGQGIGDSNRAAEMGGYNITGKVFSPDGKPASGVRIDLSSADFTNLSTLTDSGGNFVFGSVSAGNFTVIARPSNLPQVVENLTITRGTTPGQSFKLFISLKDVGGKSYSSAMLSGVPEDAVNKLQRGMEKAAKKDAKGAMVLYDQAIAAYPSFAAAYYQKGTAYLQLNEPDKALAAFVKAIEIKPDYLEAKYSYGYTEYVKKNYEIAAAAFDDVIKSKINLPEAYMYLGISLYHLNNLRDAEAQLKLATASNAGERIALAHRFLGGIYIQKKNRAAAAAELQKYVDLVPKAPDASKLRSTIADLKKPA